MAHSVRLAVGVVLAVALTHMAACGGGGNPPGPGGVQRPTTFMGQMNQPSAQLNASMGADAVETAEASSTVQVCVAETDFCTEVDATGAFTLAADVGGNVVLVFTGPNFTARLVLSGVPRGATVRIESITCSVASGECQAANVQIIAAPNAPPDCAAAMASPAVLWPPNHDMMPIRIVGVVDPDGDPVAITATDVSQNEAVDEPGSGNTGPDAQLAPLAVRAERSGQGDGRVYVISFIAGDGEGGTCTGTVRVCVPHDQGQSTICG